MEHKNVEAPGSEIDLVVVIAIIALINFDATNHNPLFDGISLEFVMGENEKIR